MVEVGSDYFLGIDKERELADSIAHDMSIPLENRLRMLCALRWRTFYNHGGYRYNRELPSLSLTLDEDDPTTSYLVDDFFEDALLAAARNGISKMGVNGDWARFPWDDDDDDGVGPGKKMELGATIMASYGPLGRGMGSVYDEAERFGKLKGVWFSGYQSEPYVENAYFKWFDMDMEDKFDGFPLPCLLDVLRSGVDPNDVVAAMG